MKAGCRSFWTISSLFLLSLFVSAQATPTNSTGGQSAAQTNSPVALQEGIPRVVKSSGVLKDADGHPRIGPVGVIFAIYDKEDAVAPVWLESQSVTADESGRYNVLLGSSKAEGLPASIFSSGEARWIGVQAEGQAEQARTLLVSVPYALKAADSDT
ncbi:MAG: hypothetical protein JWN45_2102, partial [Acidobacteriaceae bacterium]|nr:hypothetical protein [Acidobacteriaceae bacterium]